MVAPTLTLGLLTASFGETSWAQDLGIPCRPARKKRQLKKNMRLANRKAWQVIGRIPVTAQADPYLEDKSFWPVPEKKGSGTHG